jgi:hypothetical protein
VPEERVRQMKELACEMDGNGVVWLLGWLSWPTRDTRPPSDQAEVVT